MDVESNEAQSSQGSMGLSRQSSLILQTTPRGSQDSARRSIDRRPLKREDTEIIPDSQEERLGNKGIGESREGGVIWISSDSEDEALEGGEGNGNPFVNPEKAPKAKAPTTQRATKAQPIQSSARVLEGPFIAVPSSSDEDGPENRGSRLNHASRNVPTDVEDDEATLTVHDGLDSRKPAPQPLPSEDPFAASPRRSPRIAKTKATADAPATPTSVLVSASPAGTPRKGRAGKLSKKAQAEAEYAERAAYAEKFFHELNEKVFHNRLPTTELVWNKRLQVTAGKARWHRDRNGVDTTTIELAEKVLVSVERIRCTMSHEMCHLASWLISGEAEENHGAVFKSWGKKVTAAFPDITVSTTHTYEIEYKFQWKCSQCDKIYGRHSKSIDPKKCVCSICKAGELVPLFQTRTPRTPKTQADSRLASARGRDSPSIILCNGNTPVTPSPLKIIQNTPSASVDKENMSDIIERMAVIDLTLAD